MSKRSYLMGMVLTALVSFAWVPSQSFAQAFEQGRHYIELEAPTNVPTDRVVVTEAFAYPCPACRNFLPIMTDWADNAPSFVEVERLPIVLRPSWEPFARAYYTAQAMGLGHEAHEVTFKALHDERQPIRSMQDIGKLYEPFGVDANEFVAMSESFAVESQMGRNRTEVRRFGIRSTPGIVVQGKWRMNLNEFGSYQEMMQAVDELVAREAALLDLSDAADDANATDDSEADSGAS